MTFSLSNKYVKTRTVAYSMGLRCPKIKIKEVPVIVSH